MINSNNSMYCVRTVRVSFEPAPFYDRLCEIFFSFLVSRYRFVLFSVGIDIVPAAVPFQVSTVFLKKAYKVCPFNWYHPLSLYVLYAFNAYLSGAFYNLIEGTTRSVGGVK